MKYIYIGKNLEVTDDLKDAVEKKFGRKLTKYFFDDTEVNVTMSVERELQKLEVTIPMHGNIIRTEQASNDMYSSIDLAVEALYSQLSKHRKKLIDHYQSGGFTQEYIDEDLDEEEEGIRIVRTKRFAVKPMDPEEACLQMEMLGHTFYVFRNADTDEVAVVYKRKDGAFGLIEPEL